MRIYQAENYKAMSRRAANIISAQVIHGPTALGLGTGGTLVGLISSLWSGIRRATCPSRRPPVNLTSTSGCPPP